MPVPSSPLVAPPEAQVTSGQGDQRSGVSTPYFEAAFSDCPLMGIFRGLDPHDTVAICQRAWDLGVHVVEVPIQSREAVPSLRAAIAAARERGLTVGAGSVTTREQVEEAEALGAAFTVAPGLHEVVIEESAKRSLPHLPGVASASEIVRARDLGHVWLKAFPATVLTPGWIRAQLAWSPHAHFVATGGVQAANASDFLAAGCSAVAVGSAFSDADQMHRLAALVAKAMR